MTPLEQAEVMAKARRSDGESKALSSQKEINNKRTASYSVLGKYESRGYRLVQIAWVALLGLSYEFKIDDRAFE